MRYSNSWWVHQLYQRGKRFSDIQLLQSIKSHLHRHSLLRILARSVNPFHIPTLTFTILGSAYTGFTILNLILTFVAPVCFLSLVFKDLLSISQPTKTFASGISQNTLHMVSSYRHHGPFFTLISISAYNRPSIQCSVIGSFS